MSSSYTQPAAYVPFGSSQATNRVALTSPSLPNPSIFATHVQVAGTTPSPLTLEQRASSSTSTTAHAVPATSSTLLTSVSAHHSSPHHASPSMPLRSPSLLYDKRSATRPASGYRERRSHHGGPSPKPSSRASAHQSSSPSVRKHAVEIPPLPGTHQRATHHTAHPPSSTPVLSPSVDVSNLTEQEQIKVSAQLAQKMEEHEARKLLPPLSSFKKLPDRKNRGRKKCRFTRSQLKSYFVSLRLTYEDKKCFECGQSYTTHTDDVTPTGKTG